MSTPYIYPILRPPGPLGERPEDGVCGVFPDNTTYPQVGTTYWDDLWTWMVGAASIDIELTLWVYNATQRGTYYFQLDANGALLGETTELCGAQQRVFSGLDAVARYSYTPCGTNEACGGRFFCIPRNAGARRAVTVTLNGWQIDPEGAADPTLDPNIYWYNPTVRIDTCSFLFGSCYSIPIYMTSGYGCNSNGYDCFGQGGGSPVWDPTVGKGYWNYNFEAKEWIYTSSWYTRNQNEFECGQCTYCVEVKGGNPLDCSPGGYNIGCRNVGDHDIWQNGNAFVRLKRNGSETPYCGQ
jgi:hypothetical protein